MQSLTDLDAEAILLNAMSRKVPMKPWSKNHSYFGRLIMPLTMPVLKEILLPRLIAQRKMG
jgi:hypothetical protein